MPGFHETDDGALEATDQERQEAAARLESAAGELARELEPNAGALEKGERMDPYPGQDPLHVDRTVFSAIAHELEEELKLAEARNPLWPRDYVHGASIVAEEAGEVSQAANQVCYEGGEVVSIYRELRHVGAVAIRLMAWLRERGYVG
jgi:hypothetical protein